MSACKEFYTVKITIGDDKFVYQAQTTKASNFVKYVSSCILMKSTRKLTKPESNEIAKIIREKLLK